jgi:ATP-binding protein involved in chromosome partitioning
MDLEKEKNREGPLIIAVGAGKGGVGKSAITVQMAYVHSALGYKVGIIDADIYGPSMSVMMPKEERMPSVGEKIVPPSIKGIKVLSLAYFAKWQDTHVIRAPIANTIIKNFLTEVDWGDTEIIFMDLPPGTGDIHITIMQTISITSALIVTTPQKVAVIDVEKTILMFQKMAVPILGLIENMSFFRDSLTGEKHFPFGIGGGEALQEKFSIPLLGKVPLDQVISESLDDGSSIFETNGSFFTKKMLWEIGLEIAHKICDNRSHKNVFFEVDVVDETHFSCKREEKTRVFSYRDLQKNCPCARCFDPQNRLSLKDPDDVDPNLTSRGIERIGNYGLHFHFTSGCDQGVYTWDFLEKLFLSS